MPAALTTIYSPALDAGVLMADNLRSCQRALLRISDHDREIGWHTARLQRLARARLQRTLCRSGQLPHRH